MSSAEQPQAPKFDHYADEYHTLHAQSITASGESTEYFARYKLDCLHRMSLPADGPVLDYGCGIGNVTEQLVRSFTNVHAYDPSGKSLAVARQRAPTATFYENADALPDGKFEAIILSGVLHHVPPSERVALMSGLRAKLAPSGRVVVFEHNPLNPLTRRVVKNCAFDDDAILLWPWEAKRLLGAAGFRTVALDYIVFFPHALAKLRWLEPKLGWLLLGAQMMIVGSGGD